MSMKTFEYRLFVKKEQSCKLMACLRESRTIYNGMLEMVKAQDERDGTFPSKYELEAAFKGKGEHVPATTVQMLADRLSKSLKRFLVAKQNDIPGIGFPRFKKPNRWHSIPLRQYGKDCYLHEDKNHLIVPKKMGHFLKINRQRRDHHFKTAKPYAERYHHLAIKDLQITNMVKNHHLSKSILDAGWGQFLDILEDRAARAGHQVIRVNPRFTSQKCHQCGEIVQKSLSVRTHVCPFCGCVADRDVNAAKNILQAARLGHSLQEPTYTDRCRVS